MRIGYVATDEVNHALAARMAAKCGAIICHLRPREVHPDGLFDAVLYDLDDVPRDQQPAFLEELCLGTPDCPTAGYLYVEGTDHNLWLESPGWQQHGRTWVDGNVQAFAPA
jgi:hypothetical protein